MTQAEPNIKNTIQLFFGEPAETIDDISWYRTRGFELMHNPHEGKINLYKLNEQTGEMEPIAETTFITVNEFKTIICQHVPPTAGELEAMYAWYLKIKTDKWNTVSLRHLQCLQQLDDEGMPEMKYLTISECGTKVIKHQMPEIPDKPVKK